MIRPTLPGCDLPPDDPNRDAAKRRSTDLEFNMHRETIATEDRLLALIQSGYKVSLTIDTQAEAARVKFSIKQGEVSYGGQGFAVVGEAEGPTGLRQLRASIAAAEAFCDDGLISLLPVHLPGRAQDDDALHSKNRQRNRPEAEALDRAADLEPVL